MTAEDFVAYVSGLGWKVETITGADGGRYIAIMALTIPGGALAGRTCDVAIRRDEPVPYIPPAAIHTRPALVAMGTLNTQASGIGSDWQYWSRRFDHSPTPARLWAHILTVLTEVT
jgi:hypothetical protein